MDVNMTHGTQWYKLLGTTDETDETCEASQSMEPLTIQNLDHPWRTTPRTGSQLLCFFYLLLLIFLLLLCLGDVNTNNNQTCCS